MTGITYLVFNPKLKHFSFLYQTFVFLFYIQTLTEIFCTFVSINTEELLSVSTDILSLETKIFFQKFSKTPSDVQDVDLWSHECHRRQKIWFLIHNSY